MPPPSLSQSLGVSWQCRALKRCVGDACKAAACSPICKDPNDCYCSQESLTGSSSSSLELVPKEHFFTDASECQFEDDEYTASGVLVLIGECAAGNAVSAVAVCPSRPCAPAPAHSLHCQTIHPGQPPTIHLILSHPRDPQTLQIHPH